MSNQNAKDPRNVDDGKLKMTGTLTDYANAAGQARAKQKEAEKKKKEKEEITRHNWSGRGAAEQITEENRGPTLEEVKASMTQKQKRQNFWEYNRVKIIVGALVVALIVFCTVGSINREKYDVTIVLAVSQNTLDQQTKALEEILSRYAEDYNGDGVVNVHLDVENLPIDDESYSADMVTAMQARYAGEMAVGEISLYIMDDTLIEYYEAEDVMLNLTEKYGEQDSVEGVRFSLTESVYSQSQWLQELLPDAYIMQRIPDYMDGMKKEKIQQQYEYDSQFLQNLLSGTVVTEIEPQYAEITESNVNE